MIFRSVKLCNIYCPSVFINSYSHDARLLAGHVWTVEGLTERIARFPLLDAFNVFGVHWLILDDWEGTELDLVNCSCIGMPHTAEGGFLLAPWWHP